MYHNWIPKSKWQTFVACENIRFSSLFAAGDVSRGGTSATQRQKFHTDDANQCLHNESGSHGVPNINSSNFACLLVDLWEVLCSSANELQQNSNSSSREDYFQKYPKNRNISFVYLKKNPYLNQASHKNTCQNFPTEKNPEIEINHPCHLIFGVPPNQNGAPIWRLHTKLYKGAWNVSANNSSETVGHKDLRLG